MEAAKHRSQFDPSEPLNRSMDWSILARRTAQAGAVARGVAQATQAHGRVTPPLNKRLDDKPSFEAYAPFDRLRPVARYVWIADGTQIETDYAGLRAFHDSNDRHRTAPRRPASSFAAAMLQLRESEICVSMNL